MKLFAALASCACAIPFNSLGDLEKKDFQLPIAEGIQIDFDIIPKNITPEFRDVNATIENRGSYYRAQLQIGSNKQTVGVDVDTGSADLWVVANNASCGTGPECKGDGVYDYTTSTTAKDLHQQFNIFYVDGATATGEYFTDEVTFGGVTAKDIQFANVYRSEAGYGIFGIGIQPNYKNFPAKLAEQGIISKNYYSMYLGSPDASTGTLLLGGTDPSKYSGEIVYADMASEGAMTLELESIDNGKGGVAKTSLVVPFDTGSTLTNLPAEVTDLMASAYYECVWDTDRKAYYTDCGHIPWGHFLFNFKGGATIKVRYLDFIWYRDITRCYLSFVRGDGPILGDSFMRSAYVVFDIDDHKIGLANTTWKDIVS